MYPGQAPPQSATLEHAGYLPMILPGTSGQTFKKISKIYRANILKEDG
jgi:hypothetical protein